MAAAPLAVYCRGLQAALERSWAARGYDEGVFHELAAQALVASSPAGAFSLDELLGHIVRPPPEAPPQPAHPAPEMFVLARGPRFDIRAHVWTDNVAVPHSHEWAGAFAIISGSSLNASYRFGERARLGPGLRVGELERQALRELGSGAVVPVQAGDAFIHAVAHLERPGVALSVRAAVSLDVPRTHLRPGVSFSLDTRGPEPQRKLQALTLAHALDPVLFERLLEEALAGDPALAYLLVCEAVQREWPLGARAIDAARRTFGAHFEQLWRSLDELRAYQRLVELRADAAELPLRRFLAALYLCDDRQTLLAALEDEAGGLERSAQLGRWLAQLLLELEDQEGELETEVPPLVIEALGRGALGLEPGPLVEAARASGDAQEHATLELCAAALASVREDPLLGALARAR